MSMQTTSTKPINTFSGRHFWLSNFVACSIVYKNRVYPTTEHAYQAQKTSSIEWQQKIQEADGPRQAKFLGRQCPLRDDWDSLRDQVMLEVSRLKYQQPTFGNKLVATYPRELIEGNYWGDTYWGVHNGKGENKLGKILMRVRQELMDNQKTLDGS